MWTAAFILAGILLAALLLLAAPVEFRFQVETAVGLRGFMRVEWLFGLVSKDLATAGKRRRKPALPHRGAEPERTPEDKARGGSGRSASRVLSALLNSRGFPERLLYFLQRTISAFRIREMTLRLRLGLDDPADTGFLFAVAGPLLAALAAVPKLDLRAVPEFDGEFFHLLLRGDIRFVPLHFLWAFAFFVLSPASLRALRSALAAVKK